MNERTNERTNGNTVTWSEMGGFMLHVTLVMDLRAALHTLLSQSKIYVQFISSIVHLIHCVCCSPSHSLLCILEVNIISMSTSLVLSTFSDDNSVCSRAVNDLVADIETSRRHISQPQNR